MNPERLVNVPWTVNTFSKRFTTEVEVPSYIDINDPRAVQLYASYFIEVNAWDLEDWDEDCTCEINIEDWEPCKGKEDI